MIRNVRDVADSSPKAWLLRGAIREDDNPNEEPPTPQDVSPGLRRPLHHFFDPYYNRALSAGASVLDSDIHKNPDWAIGSRDSFNAANNREIGRRNHFSIFDAREAMFRALTLKRLNQDGSFSDVDSTANPATRYQWRKAYWATTFRALGDVVHLVQDMAQPQHTRNEPHSGMGCVSHTSFCLGGHASVFEKYINARVTKTRTFTSGKPFDAVVPIVVTDLDFGAYPLPSFRKYSDYWSTSPGVGSLSGQGMADYSNRGFFTAKYNLGTSEFPEPSSNLGSYAIVQQTPVRWDGTPMSGSPPVYSYQRTVRDTLTGQDATNVPLTTYSLWDQFLQSRSAVPSFSLNRQNYDAMADLLIPRAVAYSAGLINYFFRGRLEISVPHQGAFALADHARASGTSGFKKLRAKVKNATPPVVTAAQTAYPQDMTGGSLFAVVRYHTDSVYRENLSAVVGAGTCAVTTNVFNYANPEFSTICRDGTEQIVVSAPKSLTLASGGEQEIEFDFGDAPIPLAATDLQLQIVYRGTLGDELDAVVVGTADISEPTYFTFHNVTDYISIGAEVYTRAQIDASPPLLSQVSPAYCVDQSQTPPRLRDTCFNPVDIDLELGFGDADPQSNPTVSVNALPQRRFLRIVYLTSGDYSDYKRKATGVPRIRASVRPGHSNAKSDSVRQLGYCLPHDDYHIVMRAAQFVETGPQPGYYLGAWDSLRGINGWWQTGCVNSGDGQVGIVTFENLKAAADDLSDDGDETSPYSVTLASDFAP